MKIAILLNYIKLISNEITFDGFLKNQEQYKDVNFYNYFLTKYQCDADQCYKERKN